MPRFATIDLGSNSVLVHVAERGADGRFQVLVDRAVLTRLGEGLGESGRLQPVALERTLVALGEFVALCRDRGVEDIAAVGTMALRNAANAQELIGRAEQELGLYLQVISGEEEARLAYLAARSGIADTRGRTVVFDTGGGSTEFVLGEGPTILDRFSRDLGALRLTAEFLVSDPVRPEELRALHAWLEAALADVDFGEVQVLVGLGGTICNLAAMHHGLVRYDADRVQGTRLKRAVVERQIETLRGLSIAQRRALPGIQPKRADTILAGAAVVLAVLRRLDTDVLLVSDRGLRHGLLHDRFGDGRGCAKQSSHK